MLGTIFDFLGKSITAVFAFGWVFGAILGAIYWAIQGNLLQVVLSILPLWGAVSMIWDLII
jgi:hypothetical protein